MRKTAPWASGLATLALTCSRAPPVVAKETRGSSRGNGIRIASGGVFLSLGPQSPQKAERIRKSTKLPWSWEADPAEASVPRAVDFCQHLPHRAAQSCARDAGRGTEDGHSGREAGSRDSWVGGCTA